MHPCLKITLIPLQVKHLYRQHNRILTISPCCLHCTGFTSIAHSKGNVWIWVDDWEGKVILWRCFRWEFNVRNPFLIFFGKWILRESEATCQTLGNHSLMICLHPSINQVFETGFMTIRSQLLPRLTVHCWWRTHFQWEFLSAENLKVYLVKDIN